MVFRQTPSHILKNIDPQLVLDYAIEKYKLNADNYKVTHVHKINNLTNEDESKNVIYFFYNAPHKLDHLIQFSYSKC